MALLVSAQGLKKRVKGNDMVIRLRQKRAYIELGAFVKGTGMVII